MSAWFLWKNWKASPTASAPKGPSLEYVFASNRRAVSTNPLDSDSLVNMGHMEQLIGTLIKQGAGGRLEPYLATSWTVSPDYRSWNFKMREGLTCENGQPIDAASFKRSLERNFRLYATNPIPVFQDLVGWSEFFKGGSLSGLEASPTTVAFNFTHPVKTGVLEFLSMAYYGFYCDQDYDEHGRWKDPKRVTSSGAYSLAEIEPDGTSVRLRKRDGWFSLDPLAPPEVRITQKSFEHAYEDTGVPRIIFGYPGDSTNPKDLVEVPSIPDILIALVLSPTLQNLFHDPANRKVFHARFRRVQAQMPPADPTDLVGNYFYPAAPSELPEVAHPEHFTKPLQKRIRVVVSDHLDQKHVEWLGRALREVFSDVKAEVVIERMDRNDPHALQRIHANSAYDIRVAGVSIGGNFLNWVVDMMFCSKLGVSFPDPSGRICKLVRDFDRTDMSLGEYTKRFNSVLHEDMAVIPFFHRRYAWLISPGIDYALSPISGSPRFDLIKVKP